MTTPPPPPPNQTPVQGPPPPQQPNVVVVGSPLVSPAQVFQERYGISHFTSVFNNEELPFSEYNFYIFAKFTNLLAKINRANPMPKARKNGDIPKMHRGVRHITILFHPTTNDVKNSYVHNRPMLCKRKDIGGELPKMSLSKDDLNIIENVSMNNPEMSPSLRNKRIK